MHNHGNSNEIAEDFIGSNKRLLTYNKRMFHLMSFAWICAFAASILSLIGPDKLSEITDIITEGIMTGIDLSAVTKAGIFLLIIFGLSFLFNYLEGFIMAHVTTKYARIMRDDVSMKINRLPMNYFDKTTIGDLLSRITNDIDIIGHTLGDSLSTLLISVTMFAGSLFMMIKTSPLMALAAVSSSIIGFIFMFIILSRSQKYFNKVQEELGKMNGHIEEVYSGHNVVSIYNAKPEMKEKFEKINESLFLHGRKSQFYSGLMHPIMGFIGNLGYVVVCLTGAVLVINESITFGVIVAFMIYVRLFTQSLTQFAQGIGQLQSTAAAAERVFEFLDADELVDESKKEKTLAKDKARGEIEFKNVSFGYEEDKTIISDFNLKAKPGSKIAIVGPTGSGKTTLVGLLMKFYEIKKGDITIDGVSIHDLKRENVHDLFVMVLQDTWLFEGTIYDNIRFNDPSISDEQIRDVCKKIGLDHFIKTLPSGYDTVVNDSNLMSAGQKQLVTIARAMVDDSPFLILDEATSSVDTRTEILVQKAMDKLTEKRTSFIIAHRLSTIKNADLILVLKDGRIIEQGTHKELLKKDGFYADLYNSQFQNSYKEEEIEC